MNLKEVIYDGTTPPENIYDGTDHANYSDTRGKAIGPVVNAFDVYGGGYFTPDGNYLPINTVSTPIAQPILAPVTVTKYTNDVQMTYTNPNPSIKPITDNATLTTIKSVYVNNINNPQYIVNAMKQYGVSMYDMANATSLAPSYLAARFGQPDGFGGYYAPKTVTTPSPITGDPVITGVSTGSNNTLLIAAAAGAALLMLHNA